MGRRGGCQSRKDGSGACLFFDLKSGKELWRVEVGANPDMIAVTGDGKTVLVANEGEPNEAYDEDPDGSIIDRRCAAAKTADFRHFNPQRKASTWCPYRPQQTACRQARYGRGRSRDIAPADGSKAWITLQENNAIASVHGSLRPQKSQSAQQRIGRE